MLLFFYTQNLIEDIGGIANFQLVQFGSQGQSSVDVTSPSPHFARLLTQPEVKFDFFERLKRDEENTLSIFFFDVHIRISCR